MSIYPVDLAIFIRIHKLALKNAGGLNIAAALQEQCLQVLCRFAWGCLCVRMEELLTYKIRLPL